MNNAVIVYIVKYSDIEKAKRLIFTRHLCCESDNYSIVRTAKGQPLLYKDGAECEKISISHTDNMLAVAFANCSVGIDLERKDRIVSERICTGIEEWTRYEAYGKWLGEGISKSLLKRQLPKDLLRTHTVGEYFLSVCSKTDSPDIISVIDNIEI